ncbi:MAG: ABC transporter permease [Dehalococcoidia bacterium]|nr:ABC transporter permease [Dehalococcoidia bacterium]
MSITALLDRVKLKRFLPSKKRRPGYIVIPMAILALFLFVGAFGPMLAPHSPTDMKLSIKYDAGFWDGNWSYPLGTDQMGRDVLSRIIVGARTTLTFCLLAIAFAGTVGTLLGLIAGYFGSWVDMMIMRIVDLAMSVPFILLAMVLTIALGQSFMNLVIVISLLLWAGYARQVRAETLSIKERDFVAFAKVSGVSSPRIVATHVFPNLLHVVVVLATLQVGYVILMEAALSYLGVGIPPPEPVWGTMVADGKNVLNTAWWVSAFPGIAIGAVVLSLNLFGDWLRDKLDPRLRQV